MPYRIDLSCPPPHALDLLVEWGALDIEPVANGLAAILPDSVSQYMLATQLGKAGLTVSAAVGRDDGSVWMLSPRAAALPNALQLIESDAFGTGHHPTTALCIEALEEIVNAEHPDSILDVGTGSGILALTALLMGVTRAVGLDIDANSLQAAAENARLNHLSDRIELILGTPDLAPGQWPLVVANILAAPLIEMAPILVQRLGRSGRLILSGIHESLESEVRHAYRRLGVRGIQSKTRAGWSVLTAQAPW